MMKIKSKQLSTFTMLIAHATLSFGSTSVVDTVHNLSTSGPGELKSQAVDQVCAFCHTPHRAARGRGLWNRAIPNKVTPYESPTSSSVPENLSGPSALCMSCHDGTIALGDMLHAPGRGQGIDMRNQYLTGRSRFGTNLSNHHPVGIDYVLDFDTTVSGLADPNTVALPLTDGQVHCTSCHDAHSNNNPPFLLEPSNDGVLCLNCHYFSGDDWDWSRSAHATSEAVPRSGNPWRERKAEWTGQTVAENACENCHASHNAASAVRLIIDNEEQTCFRCHNGSVADKNIQNESLKFYRHPVEMPSGRDHQAERVETTFSTPLHVECDDCHNPHAARKDDPMISFNPGNPADRNHAQPPFVNGSMRGVTGLDINGQPKIEAAYEYEVCFKCHGVPGRSSCEDRRCSTATNLQMARQDNEYNLREKFNPANPSLISYHPVYSNNPENDSEVPSLRLDIPLNPNTSQIYCGDCHASPFSPAAGGNGASGPHGSRHAAILALSYELDAGRRFNSGSNELCFKCHDQGSLYSDESFLHRMHVLEKGAGCVNCHDPHGSLAYPHLINFLTTASSRARLVKITGAGIYREPTWTDAGSFSGTCSLNCHGVVHEDSGYGSASEPPALR